MFLLNYQNVIDPILRDVRRAMPVFAGMQPGDKVLDVCCGTGAQVIEYARWEIIAEGVDLDPAMIAIAEAARKKLNLPDVSFTLADATDLPFEEGTFDFVSISFALHDKELSVRNAVVAEMKRVVKTGGYLVLADFQMPLPVNFWGTSVRIVECLAGGAHYQGFLEYKATGGLETILNNHDLRVEKAGLLKSGMLKIVKAGLLEKDR